MNNVRIDCLNHVQEIEGHYLTLNCYEDDIPNPVDNEPTRPKYCFIHPSGELHQRHTANPMPDNKCYAYNPGKQRLWRQYTFHIKKRNNLKRIQHKTRTNNTWESRKQDGNQQVGQYCQTNPVGESPLPRQNQTQIKRLQNHGNVRRTCCADCQRARIPLIKRGLKEPCKRNSVPISLTTCGRKRNAFDCSNS